MAKAKKKPAVDEPEPLTLGVSFGGVSFGDKTARLGVSISRGQMVPKQAEANLCERRLKVKIVAVLGSPNGQQQFPGMETPNPEMEAVVDIKGYSASGKAFSCGLTFHNDDKAKDSLPQFAKCEGQLIILENKEMPENEKTPENEDENKGGDDD